MRRALTWLALAACAGALCACERRPLGAPRADPSAALPSPAPPAAPPLRAGPPPPEAEQAFDDAAAKVVARAQEVVVRCRLHSEEPGDWFDQDIFDLCPFEQGDATSLSAAVEALERAAAAHPAFSRGVRASFVAHARMFGDWVSLATRTGASRGTLELYQRFARAFNEIKPDGAIPLDPPHVLDQYFRKMDDAHDHYLAESYRWYDERKKRGTPLLWIRGMNGPRMKN